MPSKNITCPVCESGSLVERIGREDFEYKEIKFVVDEYHFSICDECGYELVTATDAKLNDKKVREHYRVIDGFLPSIEIKRIRKKFGLTQHDAAEIFGGGANAFSKYENGDVIQSTSMDRLLRLTDLIPNVFPVLVSVAARQTLKLKSRQFFSELYCDYGTCKIADSKNLPENIIPVGLFTDAKKKKFSKTITANWLNSAVS